MEWHIQVLSTLTKQQSENYYYELDIEGKYVHKDTRVHIQFISHNLYAL